MNTTRSAYDAEPGFVGDEHDRRAAAPRERGEELDDLVARHGVERTGRLVGEQERAVGDDGPGDGDALLLPTREVVRVAVELLVQSDEVQRVERSARASRVPTMSSSSGSITFSIAVSDGMRLRRWKT